MVFLRHRSLRAPKIARRSQAWTSLLFAVVTIALHAFLIGTMVYGGGTPTVNLPNQTGAGASAQIEGGVPVMVLVFLDASISRMAEATAAVEFSSEGMNPQELLAQIASPESTPPSALLSEQDESDEPVLEAQGNTAERAKLFGRYLGQVSARIERAWYRPRTAIGDAQFRCQVYIEQSAQGRVESVELGACNGDLRWQMSLVNAIQSASPLSAPPDPGLFMSRVTLTLESAPFVAGGPEEGFEPAAVTVANNNY